MADISDIAGQLIAQKNAIEQKGGSVSVARRNPSPAEITAGINSIPIPDFSEADAVESDVLLGKKFYSASRLLLTGTFSSGANEQMLRDIVERNPINYLPIPPFVTKIAKLAFYLALNISVNNPVIPNNITAIEEGGFQQCASLTGTLTIPSSVQSVGPYAFYATSITAFNWQSTQTFIPSYCFAVAPITSVDLPEHITEVKDRVFSLCDQLVSVNLRNVTSVGGYCFYYNSKLKTVDIGPHITNFPSGYQFQNCLQLNSLTIRATTPPAVNHASCFYNAAGATSSTIKFYVPAGSVAAYKAAPIFSQHADRIFAIPE